MYVSRTADWVIVDVGLDCSAKFGGGCMELAPSPLPIKGLMQQVGYLE